MKGVQGTPESRSQLHKWMDERREQLRVSWADIARSMDMTEENLLRIRKGRISISLKAAAKIEAALQWPRGSIEAAVMRGVRPVMPESDQQPPVSPDVAPGTPGHLRRELAYFHRRLRDTPEDYTRLLDLLDLYASLADSPLSTHGGTRLDAQG